jgi:leucyl/phenylalanyl-tRNA--protein transferase
MSQINFPNPRTHEFTEWVLFGDYYYNASDIITFGGDLTIENLRSAYTQGIFPWNIERMPLPWFCPMKRAILDFSELHIPRSLAKARAKTELTFTIDKDFKAVIESCSNARRSDGNKTWITPDFIRAFCELHEAGDAHSVEVWDDEELVGGLYGVDAGGVFCGESMFFKKPNASKLALLYLVDHLHQRGSSWLDVQVMTPHFKVLGAKEIRRAEFLDKLEETQSLGLNLFD